jgi:glycosyltransferase involved in cell wall biosynthesis
MNKNFKIAAFGGFRSIPPKAGAAGSDKFAVELYPRLVKRGYDVLAYCRIYPGNDDELHLEYDGVHLKWFKTINKGGFDTLIHSFKATFDIIFHNRATIIHLQSGANSLWALPLRMAGKKVFVSQFAMDWKRDKWSWYGKLYYRLSNYMTAYFPNMVLFDNIYTKDYFEKKFSKKFSFIPYGCEVEEPVVDNNILEKLGIESGKYFLFVGRFIPDKGIHLLIKAFEQLETEMKLVLIGNSPNPSDYEKEVKNTNDKRIIFPGYIYGDETNYLIKNAYTYVQPSLIEGLSPVILTVMGLGTPLISSDIVENLYITDGNATHFTSGNSIALLDSLKFTLTNPDKIKKMAEIGKQDVSSRFNWDNIVQQFIDVFNENMKYD